MPRWNSPPSLIRLSAKSRICGGTASFKADRSYFGLGSLLIFPAFIFGCCGPYFHLFYGHEFGVGAGFWLGVPAAVNLLPASRGTGVGAFHSFLHEERVIRESRDYHGENDEIRMTKHERMTKPETRLQERPRGRGGKPNRVIPWNGDVSDFGFQASFVLRHSSFVI